MPVNKTHRSLRLSLGVVTWSVALALLVGFGRQRSGATPHATDASVTRYLLSPARSLTALDATGHVTRDVPVFAETGSLTNGRTDSRIDAGAGVGAGDRWRQVGY